MDEDYMKFLVELDRAKRMLRYACGLRKSLCLAEEVVLRNITLQCIEDRKKIGVYSKEGFKLDSEIATRFLVGEYGYSLADLCDLLEAEDEPVAILLEKRQDEERLF